MKLTQTLILALSALAVAAFAAEPTLKEQAAALGKEAGAARKERRFDDARALQEKLRALPGRSPEAIASSFTFDAETFLEQGGEGAGERALEAFQRAFAVKDLPRASLDPIQRRALKVFSKNFPEEARKVADLIVDDPASGAGVRFAAHMLRARQADAANDEKTLYAEAMAAAKVSGNFDRRDAYYLLAEHEFKKGQGVSATNTDEQMAKYLKLMDQAYEAAISEMGLPQEMAAETYLKVALKWVWHHGRPARDVAKGREAFEKAKTLGAKPRKQIAHESYEGVEGRIKDLEWRFKQFEQFPNRNWRNEDGKLLEEIDKALSAGKTVHAKDFGWNAENATEALQKALDSDASVVVVDKMETPWEIEGIMVPSCKKILLREGAVIEAKKGAFLTCRPLVTIAGTNIVIVGEGGNELRMRKSDYLKDKVNYPKFDDDRHGIGFGGKKGTPHRNLLVRNVKIASSGGDGVCVTHAKRIWLDKVELVDHVRQALTIGTGADTLYLTNCKFNKTWGGEPMSGIDVENWTENCSICEIYCEDCELADNRIYGLVLATSTYSPLSMFFKNCEFRNNHNTSLQILNRPGVPTVNKEIFENCRFLQPRCVKPIRYIRTLIGNVHFKDCLIQEIPGGSRSDNASPISVQLDSGMSGYFVGTNVFENVKVVGFKDAPLLVLNGRAGGTEYIPDGAFRGVVDFNGEKIDLAQYIKERGLDKPAPSYKAAPLDVATLTPPPLDTAIDAYIPAPYGGNIELIYWAEAGRRIKLGYFTRVSTAALWTKNRAISVVKPDGATETICDLDRTNDYTTVWYEVPASGFYRFRAKGRGFWIPQDDKVWGYCYHSYAGDGFADMGRGNFTGFFEVPEGTTEVTIQTQGGEGFELVDANNTVVAKSGPSVELQTWTCKVEAAGIWRFRIIQGSVRFFPPLNGVFADCPDNLPRMAPQAPKAPAAPDKR